MSTKNDLLTSWVKWTGDPIREVRHRIRVLSEDGLLPNRADPMTYEDLARALLGFVASETHKDAADIVRRLSGLRPGAAWADGVDEPSFIGLTLLEAVSAALKAPYAVAELKVVSGRSVDLEVHVHHPLGGGNEQPWNTERYHFSGLTDLPAQSTFPISISRSVHWDLVRHLLQDLMPNENAEAPGRVPASSSS